MANEKFARKTVILAKIEATRGTDAGPVGANAIEVGDVQLTPLEGDVVERGNIRPYFGGQGSSMVTAYRKLSFSVEAAGVAAAGDVPGYAVLLRACACSVTVAAGATVTFAPVTDSMETVTLYCVIDGLVHKMTGSMGTVKLQADAKTLPKWQFEFTGSFSPVTDGAQPVPVYTAFQEPVGVTKANTTLDLHGVSVACSAFSWDIGNSVTKRDLIGVDAVSITGRKSVGSVTIQATDVATKDWVGTARASMRGPLALRHGPAGSPNAFRLQAPNVQLGKPSYSELEGVQMVTLPLEYVHGSAGNDEWAVVVP